MRVEGLGDQTWSRVVMVVDEDEGRDKGKNKKRNIPRAQSYAFSRHARHVADRDNICDQAGRGET